MAHLNQNSNHFFSNLKSPVSDKRLMKGWPKHAGVYTPPDNFVSLRRIDIAPSARNTPVTAWTSAMYFDSRIIGTYVCKCCLLLSSLQTLAALLLRLYRVIRYRDTQTHPSYPALCWGLHRVGRSTSWWSILQVGRSTVARQVLRWHE